MIDSVNRAGASAPKQAPAPKAAGGTSIFASLLADELASNATYLNALQRANGNMEALFGTSYAPTFYAAAASEAKAMEAAEAAALQAVYAAGYTPALEDGAHPVTGLHAEEVAALQAARQALLTPPATEEEAAAQEEQAESGLSGLFGGNVNMGEALMLMCMMMMGNMGGMGGESSGLSGGMGAMISSLGKALSQKNAQEQELLRYDMLTNGYKTSNASESLDEAATYVNETLFSETSEAIFPYRASKPTAPQVISTEADRDPSLYRQVIDQFSVSTNPRYMPNKKGTGDTYCNIFLWDVTSAMGAEIPHYTDWESGEAHTYPEVDDSKHMNANRIYDWLAETGPQYGWQEVSAEQAQAAANEGRPAVTVWKNPTGGHGHCQVVCPSLDGGFNTERGVTIAQAGQTLHEYAYIDQVYSSRLPDVRYYAHA